MIISGILHMVSDVLFIANGPGNDPHNPALGRILSEQDM
jgi:hypothetical protein